MPLKTIERKCFLMDKIIDELIQNYNLSDYEALAITGVIGMVATSDSNIKEVYNRFDNNLKPIINKILNK
jgi:hypothetical protein